MSLIKDIFVTVDSMHHERRFEVVWIDNTVTGFVISEEFLWGMDDNVAADYIAHMVQESAHQKIQKDVEVYNLKAFLNGPKKGSLDSSQIKVVKPAPTHDWTELGWKMESAPTYSGWTEVGWSSGDVGVESSSSMGHLTTNLMKAVPGLSEYVKCPDKQFSSCNHTIVWEMVQHLNDKHKWTREAIADWLETLDVDLKFKDKEEIAPKNISVEIDPVSDIALHYQQKMEEIYQSKADESFTSLFPKTGSKHSDDIAAMKQFAQKFDKNKEEE